MLHILPKTARPSTKVRSHCPDCNGALAVLRVIAGSESARARSEYWAMRCTKCGGIHLDITDAPPLPQPVRTPEEHPA